MYVCDVLCQLLVCQVIFFSLLQVLVQEQFDYLCVCQIIGDFLCELGVLVIELWVGIIVGVGFVVFEVMCDMVYNLLVLIFLCWVCLCIIFVVLENLFVDLVELLNYFFDVYCVFEVVGLEVLSYQQQFICFMVVSGKYCLFIFIFLLMCWILVWFFNVIILVLLIIVKVLIQGLKYDLIVDDWVLWVLIL